MMPSLPQLVPICGACIRQRDETVAIRDELDIRPDTKRHLEESHGGVVFILP
jgi:hypothetical protein